MNFTTEFGRLKRVEWLALDIREAGSWPLLLQYGCGLLLSLLVFGVMCWLLVMPKLTFYAEAQDQEPVLLNEYHLKAGRVAHLSSLQARMKALEEQLETLVKMLPTDVDIPQLLSSISHAGLANRLQIDAIHRRPDVTHEFYIERPFDIRVRGDYHRIASFVADLAGLPQIVTQHDFTLEPIPDGDLLRLSMAAKTYSYVSFSASNANNVDLASGWPEGAGEGEKISEDYE